MTDTKFSGPVFVVDIETYYDSDFSLRKIPLAQYVNDPRFQILCISARRLNKTKGNTRTITQYNLGNVADLFHPYSPDECMLVAHNAGFDGLILNTHFGIRPKQWLDTLAMFRAVHGTICKANLHDAATFYQLGQKLAANYDNFKGRRWEDLSPEDRHRVVELCEQDIELTAALFRRLYEDGARLGWLNATNYKAIDMVTRMTTEPVLHLDRPLLERTVAERTAGRSVLLDSARMFGATCMTDIISNPRFWQLLQHHGVTEEDLPVAKGKSTPSMSASDPTFLALRGHARPAVRRLADIRLELRADTLRTRCKRYLSGNLPGKPWPVGINYAGAVTTRRQSGNSAGGGNPQNLTRGSVLREAIVAPPGYTIVAGDSKQLELRVALWLGGYFNALHGLHTGHDLYTEAYAHAARIPPSQVDKDGRQAGKIMMLQAQYGAGRDSLLRSLQIAGLSHVTPADAQAMVDAYRVQYDNIRQLWRDISTIITVLMARNIGFECPLHLMDIKRCSLKMRSTYLNVMGMAVPALQLLTAHGKPILQYVNPCYLTGENPTSRESHLVYDSPNDKHPRRLYGSKVFQHKVQCLSYLIMEAQAVALYTRTTYRPVLMAHDEIVLCVRNREVKRAKAALLQALRTVPKILPYYSSETLLLDGEVGAGVNYKEAKP